MCLGIRRRCDLSVLSICLSDVPTAKTVGAFQSISLYRAIVQRRVLQCGYAESKRNVFRRILNVLTDGAVRQFSGREFQSLGAATEKRRSIVTHIVTIEHHRHTMLVVEPGLVFAGVRGLVFLRMTTKKR